MKTAVALLIFNRPDCTARVVEAIKAGRPPVLLVVADGPRAGHPDDDRLVSQTRAVIGRVDWPCEVITCYSDVNLGCGKRVASGLDWVFANAPEAIILEDDCLPHPTFFPFCEQLLERYRDDERVHMIAGSNPIGERGPHSYYFSRTYSIWGWASWARAWRHYDYEMKEWPRLRDTGWLEGRLTNRRAIRVARYWFDETHAAPYRQWDFQWAFSGWLRDAVAVTPGVNLVSNIGYGDSATNLRDVNDPFANLPAQPMEFPLRHPPQIEVLEAAEQATWDIAAAQFAEARRGDARRRMARYLTAGITKLSGARMGL